MTTAEDALRHLRAIAASPRPAGGLAEKESRLYCAGVLRKCGFTVKEEPFEFSAFPGRYATPLAAALAIIGFLLAYGARATGETGDALVILVSSAAGIALGGWWLARRGVLSLPLLRERSVNLVATRGEPTVWIMAHIDSKSQVVPIGLRAAAIMATAIVWTVAVFISVAQMWRSTEIAGSFWPWITGAGIISAIPVALTLVGERSHGALDNATGVAAVLLTACLLPTGKSLGVIFTSAEELGLAGARAWVRGRSPGSVINFDGLDDAGELRFMWTRRRPKHLLRALRDAAHEHGSTARPSRLLPGILVDGIALADANWDSVTISKGTLSSVARIHTPRDTMDHLKGVGIVSAALIAATALKELT